MKFLLVDGYSLLYRAFFSSPPLTTREGTPTGALYGFSRMLLRLLDEYEPEFALVAMESHGPGFREGLDANYKANRSAAPDDLKTQMRLSRDLLDGLSIARYEHEGHEGDDVMGTLARRAEERDLNVIIVTGDNDLLQCADKKTSVLLTRRGVSDLDCFTPAAVEAKYGFAPPLVPDFKGLRGDTSDNIPGIPGIGDKTAMSLVGKFGSLESIYENLAEVKPPRIAGLLETHRDAAFASRDLARIVCDLPIEIDWDSYRHGAMDGDAREKALATAKLFEFKGLIQRFGPKSDAPDGEETPAAVLEEQASDADFLESTQEALEWLDARNKHALGVLLDGTSGVVFGDGEKSLYYAGNAADLKAWFEDGVRSKSVHDAKTLTLRLAECGVTLRGVGNDVFLQAYLLDPTRQNHPIEGIAEKYLSRRLPALPEEPKKRGATLFDEEETGLTPRRAQLCAAACALHDAAPKLCAALNAAGAEKLYDELELPLVDVLVTMEQTGMLLDIAHLQKLSQKLEADAARQQSEAWALAGKEFNIGSPKQLQTILFDEMGLAKGRANKTGYSTDVHTLEKLAEEHEIVRKILEYRGTTKLKSTYVDALLKGHDKQTNRIHTNLNQTGAVSGRLSSSEPNLQNIPIRTEQGREIRRAFIAPKGHKLLSADYSQIELRILAHITGDAPLVDAFRADEDVHVRTAAELFDVAVEDVDKEMRRKAKMTNYAIAYGVSGFGLARQLGSGTAGEAAEFIKKYFEALPGVKNYIDETLKEARERGYVETLEGRRRPLPEIRSPRAPERAAAERTAINHPIQGTAADIMKIAMLAIHEDLPKSGLHARMTMQVHDELVFEVPDDEVNQLADFVRTRMRDVPTKKLGLRVPLEVEIEAGQNWNEGEEVK
ncbi:MAG TPA: DNA polymerase I [Abditibacteriaceae bacterium]|jgi:DNA polymerase-1